MVEVWLPYGKTEVHVSVPLRYLAGTIEPAEMVQPENPFEVITSALSNPIGSGDLQGLVNRRNKVAVAIDGTITPFAASVAASGVVWTLGQVGVPKENVTLVVGNCLREDGNPMILEALQGADPLRDVDIYEHSRDSGDVTNLGSTSSRTDVMIASPFVEASFKIAVGEVAPDHFAGMRGAQSTVMPALASHDGLVRQRELSFQGDVVPGVFEGNPVHSDQMEACGLAEVDFSVQLVTDGWGRISSAFSGGLEPCWLKAVEALGDSSRLRAEPDADIIVVSAGGDRFDYDLYNSVWALQGIAPLVKRGATIIFLAECTQGLGAEGLESLAQVDTLAELRRRYVLGARAVYTIKSALRGNEVILVSALPSYLAEPLGFTVERTANAAFQRVFERRRNRRTLVVTHGVSSVIVPSEGEERNDGEDHHPEVNENQ
jgi:nickel-dependent lactate racemase